MDRTDLKIVKKITTDVYNYGKKTMDTHEDLILIIKNIRPGSTFDVSVSGGNYIFNSFKDPNGFLPPTKEEIEKEQKFQKECKEYYQYVFDRCNEYPDGFEQFDMLWHAINKGIDLKESDWFLVIKSIKEKYPKPNREAPIKEE
jgi:hypothetical protein